MMISAEMLQAQKLKTKKPAAGLKPSASSSSKSSSKSSVAPSKAAGKRNSLFAKMHQNLNKQFNPQPPPKAAVPRPTGETSAKFKNMHGKLGAIFGGAETKKAEKIKPTKEVKIKTKKANDADLEVLSLDDPRMEQFKKMQKIGLAEGQISHKMVMEGINPDSLFNPSATETSAAPVAAAPPSQGMDIGKRSSEVKAKKKTSFAVEDIIMGNTEENKSFRQQPPADKKYSHLPADPKAEGFSMQQMAQLYNMMNNSGAPSHNQSFHTQREEHNRSMRPMAGSSYKLQKSPSMYSQQHSVHSRNNNNYHTMRGRQHNQSFTSHRGYRQEDEFGVAPPRATLVEQQEQERAYQAQMEQQQYTQQFNDPYHPQNPVYGQHQPQYGQAEQQGRGGYVAGNANGYQQQRQQQPSGRGYPQQVNEGYYPGEQQHQQRMRVDQSHGRNFEQSYDQHQYAGHGEYNHPAYEEQYRQHNMGGQYENPHQHYNTRDQQYYEQREVSQQPSRQRHTFDTRGNAASYPRKQTYHTHPRPGHGQSFDQGYTSHDQPRAMRAPSVEESYSSGVVHSQYAKLPPNGPDPGVYDKRHQQLAKNKGSQKTMIRRKRSRNKGKKGTDKKQDCVIS